jgi:pimeloyl-ACP methyl ester carboxylesterase
MSARAPDKAAAGKYAQVNGLNMYYEVHGSGSPLVLLHGGISNIETDFGLLLPRLSKSYQCIGIEQQAHGHTNDREGPLDEERMAEDTLELLRQIGVGNADFFGYSMGSAIAARIAIKYPQLVRKLVLAAFAFRKDGAHQGTSDSVEDIDPDVMAATPFGEAYARIAPDPGYWPKLLKKIGEWGKNIKDLPSEAVQSIKGPVMLVYGDSDIIRTEHMVEVFKLFGGGIPADLYGLPRNRMAILPATTHITLVHRAEWLVSMVKEFLDAPMPEGG